MNNKKKNCFEKIGISEFGLVELIRSININGPISQDYIRPIAKKIAKDVAKDIYEAADTENWNEDDVRLAVGRVLCKKLGIEI